MFCSRLATEPQDNKNKAPIITLLGPQRDTIELYESYATKEPGWIASDEEDGDLTAFVEVDYSGIDTTKPGNYDAIYVVKDSDGFESKEYRRVIVSYGRHVVANVLIVDTILKYDTTAYTLSAPLITITGTMVIEAGVRLIVKGVIQIAPKGCLRIEHGAKIFMGRQAGIKVDGGSLYLNGTADEPLIIKNYEGGVYWGQDGSVCGGICILENKTSVCVIEHCIIDSADQNAIFIASENVKISNTTIRNCRNDGIVFAKNAGPADSSAFFGNFFINNGTTEDDFPLSLDVSKLGRLYKAGTFLDNKNQAIKIMCRDTSGYIAESGIWRNQGVPYVFLGTYGIIKSCSISVEPGIRFLFSEKTYLRVMNASRFEAIGTQSDSIIFTRFVDTLWWGTDAGLFFEPGSNGRLSYCSISWGQRNGIYLGSSIAIDHSAIFNCKEYGIFTKGAQSNTAIDTATIRFGGNGKGDITGQN